MAEETGVKVTDKVIELWASTADAFLQDFKKALEDNDLEGIIVASARLSQFGSTLSAFFLGGTQAACNRRPDHVGVANKACKQTYDMIHSRLDAIAGKTVTEPAELSTIPALPVAPDRKLN